MSKCLTCNIEIEFLPDKQNFYATHKFPHEPLFCNDCQEKRLSETWKFPALNRTIVCSICGKTALLHFTPSENEPLQCKSCYDMARSSKKLVSHET